jgi:hypothetical protein
MAPTHDVDSLVSHAIGEIWQPGVEHKSIEYGSEDLAFATITKTNNQHIIMSDLGYGGTNSIKRMIFKLEDLRTAGTTVAFYDQHNWPDAKTERAFDKYISRDDISSAEIMARDIVPNNEVAMYLAGLATLDDYNKPNEQSEDLKDMVNSRFPKDRLYLELAALETPELILSPDAKTALTSYRKGRNKALETLESTYEEHDTPIGRFATGLAPEILYMKPGHRKLRDDHPDLSMICFYEGMQNVTFRTQTPEQMVQLVGDRDGIQGLFQGGGRGTEGGFDPGEVINTGNYARVRNSIIEKIRALK